MIETAWHRSRASFVSPRWRFKESLFRSDCGQREIDSRFLKHLPRPWTCTDHDVSGSNPLLVIQFDSSDTGSLFDQRDNPATDEHFRSLLFCDSEDLIDGLHRLNISRF